MARKTVKTLLVALTSQLQVQVCIWNQVFASCGLRAMLRNGNYAVLRLVRHFSQSARVSQSGIIKKWIKIKLSPCVSLSLRVFVKFHHEKHCDVLLMSLLMRWQIEIIKWKLSWKVWRDKLRHRPSTLILSLVTTLITGNISANFRTNYRC